MCAIVCQHYVWERERRVGFVENCTDPLDLQAWCRACEERFLAEGAPTQAFLAFNSFAVVCATCYEEMKWRHTERSHARPSAARRDTQRADHGE